MTGKLLMLLVIYAAISIADVKKLKKLDRREIFAYSAMVLLSLYLGVSYVFTLKWPFLEEAASALFSEPARRLVKYLKVPS